MTEYWKSQARKYCDFCKCWLADNKVSISFHENGKRHKENVQKHISQLSKKSAKDFKQKGKMDDEIKKMEAAAMAAYLKDVENNADLTSQSINEMLNKSNKSEPVSVKKEASIPTVKPEPPKTVWQEVKSDNGNYFWNMETNETTWDPPDNYLSLAQQAELELKQKEEEKRQERIKKEKQKESMKEVKAHMAREQMRELAVKQEEKPPPSTSFGPSPRPNLFGSWTPVINKPEEKVDLQLPKITKEVIQPLAVYQPEGKVQFKEMKVQSLGEGPVEFKRRKFNSAKRNIRQKVDDD